MLMLIHIIHNHVQCTHKTKNFRMKHLNFDVNLFQVLSGLFEERSVSRTGRQRNTAVSVSNFSMVPNIFRDSDMIGAFTERVATVLASDCHLTTLPVPLEIEPLDNFMVWHNRNDANQQQSWFRSQIVHVSNLP